MPLSLGELTARVPQHTPARIEVDISHLLDPPEEPGTGIIVLREPDIDRLYTALTLVRATWKRHPLWTHDKCFNVLLLGQAHAEPVPADPADIARFYEHLAEHNTPAFVALVRPLHAALPWLQSLFGAAEERAGE